MSLEQSIYLSQTGFRQFELALLELVILEDLVAFTIVMAITATINCDNLKLAIDSSTILDFMVAFTIAVKHFQKSLVAKSFLSFVEFTKIIGSSYQVAYSNLVKDAFLEELHLSLLN